MSDIEDPAKFRSSSEPLSEQMLSIDVHGRDREIWEKREPRFVERILNSFKMLFGGDIRPEVTANTELLDAADTMAKNVLSTPQIKNLERQVAVKLKMAEILEREANARKTSLEADKLAMEIERENVLHSQKVIELAIKRGELVPIKKDGELVIIYTKKRTIDSD